MAVRPFWKGYLKLSLVTCPVAMTPVVSDSEKVRFHTMNRKTGNRVVSRYVDSGTGKVVDDDDQVKGYPNGKDSYVILEEDEIDAVALESTHTLDIDTFVPNESISPIWRDRPHFLFPDDEVGEEAFSVIREAMAYTGTVGISRLVLYRRERAVLLEPRGRGIVVWTLRYGDEVRDPDDYFGDLKAEQLDKKQTALMRKLISSRKGHWVREMADDPVEKRLLEIIKAKKKGRKQPKKPAMKMQEAAPDNVINIMDALRNSLKKGKSSDS